MTIVALLSLTKSVERGRILEGWLVALSYERAWLIFLAHSWLCSEMCNDFDFLCLVGSGLTLPIVKGRCC